MHVLSQCVFIRASNSASWQGYRFTFHLEGKQKDESELQMPPFEVHTAISNMGRHKPEILELSKAVWHEEPIWEEVLFLHRRHVLVRHICCLLSPARVVCLLEKDPAHSCGTELLWNEICTFRLRPLALEIRALCFLLLILQAWALSASSITWRNVK